MIFSCLLPDIPQSPGLFTIWLKFPVNSAKIQSQFVSLGKGFCWPLQATPSQEHALPSQTGGSGGPALLCVCVGYPPQAQGDVSFPEFQVYNSLMLITTTQREDKNPGAILMVKSSSDMAILVLGSVHCQPPWIALLTWFHHPLTSLQGVLNTLLTTLPFTMCLTTPWVDGVIVYHSYFIVWGFL